MRGLVVLSGGFGERGDDDGRRVGPRSAQLVAEARANGMRVVGPELPRRSSTPTSPCGSTHRSRRSPPLAGRAGFFAQSGALGVAVLGEAARRGIGVSTFVSAGNRADVSGNDLLQFWETDPSTPTSC